MVLMFLFEEGLEWRGYKFGSEPWGRWSGRQGEGFYRADAGIISGWSRGGTKLVDYLGRK